MASSSQPKRIYDVFLSFRGTDLRKNFLGHLYKVLVQNGIYTFRDSEELRKGDQISSVLMEAIEESCIAIILFSKDYASSPWCLEEVAKIMECKEQKDLTVLPVFYKVDPREVRGGRQSYQRAMAKHESKFGKDSQKVKRWKKALFDAGSLSGWHLNDGDETELIQEIVENISTSLARTPLQVAKHPVGIDSRVATLKSMLNLESDYGVLMMGLWGQGGIGKTSLAKALYNAVFRQFEGSCFLANVREISKDRRGLVTLQETLLDDILPQRGLKVSNVHGGGPLIQRRLSRKKVLLILDDVDNLCQLNALAGESNWFGDGSRIIVTTRDKHLLACHWRDQYRVYEVVALQGSEAHELLRKHAFQTHQIRTELVDSALNYAKGLPLALEVLGSSLCGVGEDVWESTLEKLSRNPDKTINNVLVVSFEGLDENEKEIFLHIACFFKGWEEEYIKKVLDSCDLHTAVGFDILIKRSLIRIEGSSVQVHDLTQAMGMDIVNQECRDDPAKRSKLWSYDDVADVLSCDVGDCAVKSIVLKLSEPTKIRISPDAFTKMRRLRLLILRNVRDSSKGPIHLPNELRWFEWRTCANRIPVFSGPKKLVGLDMGEGNVTGVVKQLKDFQQLKYITFSFCESLVRIPDLWCTPNLKELVIRNCKNIVEAHESIAYHEKLEVLDLEGCSQLSVFPNVLMSKNLQRLRLVDCKKFETFPDIPCELEGLKWIDLKETAIKELPASIENLVSLEKIHLSDCKNLVSLPSSIYKLQNMKELWLSKCPALIEFPKYEDSADVDEGNVTGAVKRLKDFQQLKYITFSFCESLVRTPDISCTPNLEELVIRNCKNMIEAHESIAYHEKLEVLDLEGCPQLSVFPNVLKSKNLRRLRLADCKKFERFPDIPCELEGLKWIYLRGTDVKELPTSIENLVSLEKMYLYDCKDPVSLMSSMYKLQKMRELKLLECPSLIGFPKYEDSADPFIKIGLSSLLSLGLSGCNLSEVELQEIPQLPPHLAGFDARNCESLQKTEDCISTHAFIKSNLFVSFKDWRYRGFSLDYLSISLPRREMPEWLLPIEEDSASFKASKDLYDQFFGLALYVVLNEQYERPLPSQFNPNDIGIVFYVNGQLRYFNIDPIYPSDSDNIWFLLHQPSTMFTHVNFDQSNGSYAQFKIWVMGNYVKKWGIRIFCKQLDDVLKVEIQDNRLMDPALLLEVRHDSIGSEAQGSHKHENSPIEIDPHKDLQDCQMRTGENNRMVSGRNQKLFALQAWKQGPCGLLIQLAEMSIAALARCFCC